MPVKEWIRPTNYIRACYSNGNYWYKKVRREEIIAKTALSVVPLRMQLLFEISVVRINANPESLSEVQNRLGIASDACFIVSGGLRPISFNKNR